jgi:hypothetical protein
MSAEPCCYRCGASLAALTPPIGRHDECPSCYVQVHVCRMCIHFDSSVPKQCCEDDAEEVFEKERANFCDWYEASINAFVAGSMAAEQQAKSSLDALFSGDQGEQPGDNAQQNAAEDLFK